MTITQQIAWIRSHPFYSVARADEVAMEKLLFEVMLHTYLTVSANCARAYRTARRMNGPQIVEAIRDCAPPCNLDLRLPIPPPSEAQPVPAPQTCIVAELPRSAIKKSRRAVMDCRQLTLFA